MKLTLTTKAMGNTGLYRTLWPSVTQTHTSGGKHPPNPVALGGAAYEACWGCRPRGGMPQHEAARRSAKDDQHESNLVQSLYCSALLLNTTEHFREHSPRW